MQKKILLVLVSALCLIRFTTQANDIEPGKEFYTVIYAPKAIAWNGDSIQLMIADAARTNIVALYNYALGGYEDNQGNLVPDPNLPDQVMVDHQTLPNGNPSPGGDPACNCPTTAVIKRDFAKKK